MSKKSKKQKKEKKKKDKKSKRKKDHRSTSSEYCSDSTDSNYELKAGKERKKGCSRSKSIEVKHADEAMRKPDEETVIPAERDSWMESAFDFKTTDIKPEREPVKKVEVSTYDPLNNPRELNPYWKSTGTGLPAFKKPNEDNDDAYKNCDVPVQIHREQKSWKKASCTNVATEISIEQSENITLTKEDYAAQLNELSAKKIKAEILGNTEVSVTIDKKIVKLKADFENAKQNELSAKRENAEEHILLMETDERGNCRPLATTSQRYTSDKDRGRKNKRTKVDTHDDGKRMRYFMDDDKYDIKQMFEREKGISAADANLQFASMSKQKKNRKGGDLSEDEEVDARHTSNNDGMQRSINAYKKLEDCDLCFGASKFNKTLLIGFGKNFYLSLPWYIGFQNGHSLLSPMQHCSASTLLDEDAWEELKSFQKALVKLFTSQNQDVLFYEIAKQLKSKNHMKIHCIPIPKSRGEMAPFYFKKAIEESEQEWSINKQLVTLGKKDLKQSIPKGLPYFWINFGMDTGFAHVIEDESRFSADFAEEVIVGILQLDRNRWRKKRRDEYIKEKVSSFTNKWKKYDFTKSSVED